MYQNWRFRDTRMANWRLKKRKLTRIIPELIFLLDHKPFFNYFTVQGAGLYWQGSTHNGWHGTEEPGPWPTFIAAVSVHHRRWLTRNVPSIWGEGTCFLPSHTSEFRPWSKNCRMSWPPIQLVQTDTQTRKGWEPLRTAEFTPSPRSWLGSRIALMAADCPSHPGVWNVSPLAPSYLPASSWPQNRGKATDLYLGTSPISRRSMWSNIPGSWCSYPSIPVQ